MLCRLAASATKLVSIPVLLVGVQFATAAEKDDKIKKLFEQRVALRTEIVTLVTAAYRQGSTNFDQVLEAQASLLSAKLDLCETKNQRIKIYDEMVRNAETSLELAKRSFQASEATRVDVLKGEAHLLDA